MARFLSERGRSFDLFAARPQELQNDYQRKHCIRAMPSFLEFLSYSWAAGNLLSGPFFEFSDYRDYINRQGLWDPEAGRPMPNPIAPGLLRLLKAVLCMLLCWAMRQRFSVSVLEAPAYFQASIPIKYALALALALPSCCTARTLDVM